MLKTTHTVGPWEAVMAYGHKIKAADGGIVAGITTHCPLTWESTANAYLIAAAPELLTACMMALDALDNHPDCPSDVRQILYRAIDKATGRARENGKSAPSSSCASAPPAAPSPSTAQEPARALYRLQRFSHRPLYTRSEKGGW